MRRCSETRRRHPISEGHGLYNSIAAEHPLSGKWGRFPVRAGSYHKEFCRCRFIISSTVFLPMPMPRSRAVHRYDRPSATWTTFGARLSNLGRWPGWRSSFFPRALAAASPNFKVTKGVWIPTMFSKGSRADRLTRRLATVLISKSSNQYPA